MVPNNIKIVWDGNNPVSLLGTIQHKSPSHPSASALYTSTSTRYNVCHSRIQDLQVSILIYGTMYNVPGRPVRPLIGKVLASPLAISLTRQKHPGKSPGCHLRPIATTTLRSIHIAHTDIHSTLVPRFRYCSSF
jgi:hypothetical protein